MVEGCEGEAKLVSPQLFAVNHISSKPQQFHNKQLGPTSTRTPCFLAGVSHRSLSLLHSIPCTVPRWTMASTTNSIIQTTRFSSRQPFSIQHQLFLQLGSLRLLLIPDTPCHTNMDTSHRHTVSLSHSLDHNKINNTHKSIYISYDRICRLINIVLFHTRLQWNYTQQHHSVPTKLSMVMDRVFCPHATEIISESQLEGHHPPTGIEQSSHPPKRHSLEKAQVGSADSTNQTHQSSKYVSTRQTWRGYNIMHIV